MPEKEHLITKVIEVSGPPKATELFQQFKEQKITLAELEAGLKSVGGAVKYGEMHIDASNKETITKLVKEFQKGKLSITELQKQVHEHGDSAEFWDYREGPNPLYKNNTDSRVGFLFNPYHHIKGKFMQHIIKPAIKQAIYFAYDSIQEHYDKDAFTFGDPRLKKIQDYSDSFIDTWFQHGYPYKSDFMKKFMKVCLWMFSYPIHPILLKKGIDITLWLAKEDIYYRPRWIMFLKGLGEVVKDFEITEGEKANMQRWH